MDPVTISMAVAPLVLSSAKLTMLFSAVRDSYKNAPTTLIATLTECKIIHIALFKIQELVYKNETDLSSRLKAQTPLREAFDGALTGCRMTLAALNLELDKLVEPKKVTNPMEIGFQTKARLVWKEDIMKQLLDQTRGQMSSLRYLIELLESETQADMLSLLKENIVEIRKILHRAKSIRSYQGVDDDQSSFHFDNQSATYGLVPSYETQLAQSPRYQRAEKAAADELLTSKIELLDEKYALEEKLEELLLDADLKDEKVAQLVKDTVSMDKKLTRLENDILSKDEKVVQLENDTVLKDAIVIRLENEILSKDAKVTRLERDIVWMQEEATQLEHDVKLKHDKMGILERDLSLKDKHLVSKTKRITELEGRSMQEVKLNGFEDDSVVDWLVQNCNVIALRQHSKEEADYSSQVSRKLSALSTSNKGRPC